MGKRHYGAFRSVPGVGKVGLGYAMAMCDPNSSIAFSSLAQGDPFYQRLAPNALKYNKDDRPSAGDIYGVFEEIVVWITEFVKVYFTIILALLSELQKLIRVYHCRFVR